MFVDHIFRNEEIIVGGSIRDFEDYLFGRDILLRPLAK